MFSKGVNHGVSLIICCVRCIGIVVVEVGQLTIVMTFKSFILILREVSDAVVNGLELGDALELFNMMFHTERT